MLTIFKEVKTLKIALVCAKAIVEIEGEGFIRRKFEDQLCYIIRYNPDYTDIGVLGYKDKGLIKMIKLPDNDVFPSITYGYYMAIRWTFEEVERINNNSPF